VRAFVLSTHYRRPLDFSDEQLQATARALESFYRLFEKIDRLAGVDVYAAPPNVDDVADRADTAQRKAFAENVRDLAGRFEEAMEDDFNTATALGRLNEILNAANRFIAAEQLDAGGEEAATQLLAGAGGTIVSLGRIIGLFETPPEAPAGEIDEAAIDPLVEQRQQARKNKDFDRADAIRDQLAEMGISVEDTPSGPVWRRM
ncbi:MAG: DALR domain-containing protein, partial [Planctomycetota bacterium]